MFGKLGWPEITMILIVVLLLFGAKRLPDTARALGRSLRILKSETKAMHDDGSADAPAPAAADEPARTSDAPLRAIQTAPDGATPARPVGEFPHHNRR
ncbi:Sec-independent protein translocase subunit TatA (plasmid) [Embleya sp. NBC_00888]|uniref:Sec-independent protein translocase subunit TatA n=1 Tax=Embleya sp. NBC_00888 TaxID=2975960 RepID=UPI002F918691|nr:Sec-independent protein translocase subunit TatA [Embleya sp. NBC_00888]